jgi:hypothetical protein
LCNGATIALFLFDLRRAGERAGRLAERLSTSEKTHEIQCWTPPAAALLIAMIWLCACVTDGSDAQPPCPPVVAYSRTEQARAAAELDALPNGTMIVRMLGDYAVLRDQARACR